MTWSEFTAYRDRLIEKSCDIADRKAKSYAGTEDRLANFKRNANRFNAKPELVLGVYLNKHMDAIERYIADNIESSEGLEENISDAIQYLVMLGAMLREREESPNKEAKAS